MVLTFFQVITMKTNTDIRNIKAQNAQAHNSKISLLQTELIYLAIMMKLQDLAKLSLDKSDLVK